LTGGADGGPGVANAGPSGGMPTQARAVVIGGEAGDIACDVVVFAG
jgi:hypothetical protein